MNYEPQAPAGRPIAADPYFSLWAGDDGVGFVHCGDGVLVVPILEDGQVLLAVERSPAFVRDALLLAGGAVEDGELLAETATRELQEELGFRAGRIDYLGELRPFKYLTSRQFVFLARDLVADSLPGDEIHPVGTRLVPLDQALRLCAEGELYDAVTVAGLCLARRFLRCEAETAAAAGGRP